MNWIIVALTLVSNYEPALYSRAKSLRIDRMSLTFLGRDVEFPIENAGSLTWSKFSNGESSGIVVYLKFFTETMKDFL